ncbi:MAG: maltose ABC transporter substrate-binding protein, partial [Lachnospiraceae bacterium]
MRKRLLAYVLSSLMVFGMLTGCNADKTGTGTNDGAENVSGSDTNLGNENQDTGKIALTVWAEEAQHDTVQKMIDSFIEAYSGEAEFEITLEAASDADTRNLLLADVQNAADVFSFPDDQLNTMVAAGALAPVPNAAEISE